MVIEPTGLYLREWKDDVLVGELDSASVDSEADTWYDVAVSYSGADDRDVSVKWGKSGDPLEEVLTGTLSADLAVAADHVLGFGVGQLGDYEFKDVIFRDASDTTSTEVVAYKYDALGRRIERTVDPGGAASTTDFYYDGPQVIEERDGTGAVEATYVYGRGVDDVLQMARGGTDYYFHQDDLGNVVAVTDGSGNVVERYDYGPFGEASYFDGSDNSIGATAIDNPYLFTGRRYDAETGLYYYRTRYLDPKVGRFISRDTLGLYGDGNNLGNGQAYVNNNPWSRVDPFGQWGVQITDWGPNIGWGQPSLVLYGKDYYGGLWQGTKSVAVGVPKALWAGGLEAVNAATDVATTGIVLSHNAVSTEDIYLEDVAYSSHSAEASRQRLLSGMGRGENLLRGEGQFVLGVTGFASGFSMTYGIADAAAAYRHGEIDYTTMVSRMGEAAGAQAAYTGLLWAARGRPVAAAESAGETTLADELAAAARRAQSKVGTGSGGLHGTRLHSAFRAEVEGLKESELYTERSYLNGRLVKWGTEGSIRVDVVHGPLRAPLSIYDLKSGSAALTTRRIQQIQKHVPGGDSVPVYEIHP